MAPQTDGKTAAYPLFFLTITLPESLRDVVRSNQKAAYTALFSCAHESLKKLAKDKRFLGSSRIGYLAVLHTWGGNLQFHPHLHGLVSKGGFTEEGIFHPLPWIDTQKMAILLKKYTR